MKFLSAAVTLVAAAFVTASPLPNNILATTGPNPNEVYVENITYGGTGCPQGSVSQSLSDDRTTFTLIFDSYIASVGPGVLLSESRKNCQLNVNLHIPQGWQYSIASADYRGYVELDKGVTALQESTYYFQGDTNQVSSPANFAGPVDKDYLVHVEIPFTSVVWSSCDVVRPINANTQVRISTIGNPKGSGMMTTDSIDGKIEHKLSFAWKRC